MLVHKTNRSRQEASVNVTQAERAMIKRGHIYKDVKNSDIKLTKNTNEQYCTPWANVNVVINIFVYI